MQEKDNAQEAKIQNLDRQLNEYQILLSALSQAENLTKINTRK